MHYSFEKKLLNKQQIKLLYQIACNILLNDNKFFCYVISYQY